MVIKLHSELYPLHAIQQAMAAFSRHAEISLETSGAYHCVSLRPARPEGADRLGREFANYVLAAAMAGPDGSAPRSSASPGDPESGAP